MDGKKADIGDGQTAEKHATALRDAKPIVDSVNTRSSKRNPAPPFTTSTLQQEASRKLSFNPARTMRVAQRLYEGIDTGEGRVGLITYMRTDSTALAGVAKREAREVIGGATGCDTSCRGARATSRRPRAPRKRTRPIRPTSFARDPDSLAGVLDTEELRLYRLIWQRALASQMAPRSSRRRRSS